MTGPDPAGGSDAGGGTSWSQIRGRTVGCAGDWATGAGACAAGVGAWARTGAAQKTTIPANFVTRFNMEEPRNWSVPETLSVLVLRHPLKSSGLRAGKSVCRRLRKSILSLQ